MNRQLLIILFLSFVAVNYATNVKDIKDIEGLQLTIVNGRPTVFGEGDRQQMCKSTHTIILSPDSAQKLYGELGVNGALINTDCEDVSDITNEEVFAVEKIRKLLPFYRFCRFCRFFFYAIPITIIFCFFWLLLQKKKSSISTENVDGLVGASKWQRFLGYVVDRVILGEICIKLWSPFFYKNYVYFNLFSFATLNPRQNVFNIGLLFICCAYFIFFESLLLWTPGKLISGERVVRIDGQRPSVKDIFIRTLCRIFLPGDIISYKLIDSNEDGSPRFWHDSVSRTMVVSVPFSRLKCISAQRCEGQD